MIGVIADDLTGATELGAAGLRHGLRAELLLAGRPGPETDLACVDADSRACAPAEAARRVTEAVRLLQDCGAQWIYKKTDSLLRGNVTAELETVVHELGLNGAVLVPANPSRGRTIVDGNYFVQGKPLAETEFVHDPQHPRRSSCVTDLLTPSTTLPVCVHRADEILPARGIILGEAPDSGAVKRWAEHLQHTDCGWLPAGGVDFFNDLLEARAATGSGPRPLSTPASLLAGREFFICGSASRAAAQFIAAQKEQGVVVFSLPESLRYAQSLSAAEVAALAELIAAQLAESRRVVLCIGLPLVPERAELFGGELVRVAAAVLSRVAVACVFAEGGATAVALARRMSWHRLPVVAELAPGVAVLGVDAGQQQLIVMPGSYAWPDAVRHGGR